MVPGLSRTRRFASAVACCPGLLVSSAMRAAARPMIRRLLMVAGVAVAGWLLGVAGQAHADQAHADTVPGARLSSVAAPAQRAAAIAVRVLDERRVVTAVHRARTVLAPARPPAILALPPVAHAPRPRTPAGSAGPSRTGRHGDAGSRAGVAGEPVIHTGAHAAPGASGKASTESKAHKAPSIPVQPRRLPQRGQALPPSAGDGGIHQAGVRRKTEPGTAQRRPAIPILRSGTVPPAVRTAADEPSFSPD